MPNLPLQPGSGPLHPTRHWAPRRVVGLGGVRVQHAIGVAPQGLRQARPKAPLGPHTAVTPTLWEPGCDHWSQNGINCLERSWCSSLIAGLFGADAL